MELERELASSLRNYVQNAPNVKKKLVMLVDDLAIAGEHVDDLLEYVTNPLDFCMARSFKLHPMKDRLFKKI